MVSALIATAVVGPLYFKPTFPKKLDKPGFLQGIWDVNMAYVSGQPTEEAFRALAAEGVKTVVCVRGTAEMNDRSVVSFDEAALLKELGVAYHHFPMGSIEEYNPTVVKRFADVLAQSKGKVLLHCTVAWRASYVWTAYLHDVLEIPLDDAIKHGTAMNLSSNRVGAMLGVEFTYETRPMSEGGLKPKPGEVSLNGFPKKLHEPRGVSVPDDDHFMDFALWDMGDVLNSSQPSEAKLRELAAKGVKTVINIRTDAEMERVKSEGFDEEAVTKALGLEYVRVPMQAPGDFNPANLDKLAKAIEGAKGKVLLHCTTATRTSHVWVAYLVRYQGVVLNDAMKHGMAMRLSDPLNDVLGREIVYKVKPGTGARPCGDGDSRTGPLDYRRARGPFARL
jgi:uncharacterized protein (TIGR01244 family)